MSKPFTPTMRATLGAAFTISLAGASGVQASTNPFMVDEVGTLRIAEAAEAKCGAEAEAAAKPMTEATCGTSGKGAAEAACGADKKEEKKVIREASCGEAKCGSGR